MAEDQASPYRRMPRPWLPPFVHPLPEADGLPARPMRHAWTRWAMALASVTLLGWPRFGVDSARVWLLPGGVEIQQLQPFSAAWLLMSIGVSVWALPHVGYRRRDWALVLLVPFWGLVVAWRLGWRAASLPYRDWRPRDDELPRVHVLPGIGMYVLAPEGAGTGGDVPAETSP